MRVTCQTHRRESLARQLPIEDVEHERGDLIAARASCYPEMVITKDVFQVAERWRIEFAPELAAVVAAQIASFVATEQPALVKRCAGPG